MIVLVPGQRLEELRQQVTLVLEEIIIIDHVELVPYFNNQCCCTHVCISASVKRKEI